MSSLADLDLYWDGVRGDNFTTATAVGAKSAEAANYGFVRTEARVFPVTEIKALNLKPARKTLRLYWSPSRNDNFTTIQAQAPEGYEFVREEGEIYADLPKDRSFTRLRHWWDEKREDNFLSGTLAGDRDARAAGYLYVRTVGFAPSDVKLSVTSTVTRISVSRYSVAMRGTGFSPLGAVQFIQLFPAPVGGTDFESSVTTDAGVTASGSPNQAIGTVASPVEFYATSSGIVSGSFSIFSRSYLGHSGPSVVVAVDIPTRAEAFVADVPAT